jgi:UDP-N-acetylmuramate-alanine ligase
VLIKKEARKLGHKDIRCIGPKDKAPSELLKIIRPGDLVITMGAGSVTHVNTDLIKGLTDGTA